LLLETTLSRLERWWRGLLVALATYGLVMVATFVFMFASNRGEYQKGFQKEVERQHQLRAAPPRS
jgi:hypothetical protein